MASTTQHDATQLLGNLFALRDATLHAAYEQAVRDEDAAAHNLVDVGIDNDEAFAKFQAAAAKTIATRGLLYTGAVWTQDGKPANLTDWCSCTSATTRETVLYERFDAVGRRRSHGTVCPSCRMIEQVG